MPSSRTKCRPRTTAPEANCIFSGSGAYQAAGPPYQAMRESFADAILIKQYNSAAMNYISLDGTNPPAWKPHPTNRMGFNYVNRVCSQTP
jgi:hypothetical protein